MVEYLTQKQISKFPEYVDKWVKIGLSTERISFDQVKRIVNNLYKEILEYNENPIIILMDSPVSAWYATLFCNHIFNNNDQIGDQVRNQVGNQVWNQVGDQITYQVGNQVRDQVRNQVENQVRDQITYQVRNQIENQVWDQVRNQVEYQVYNQVKNQVWIYKIRNLIPYSIPYLISYLISYLIVIIKYMITK